MLYSYGIRHIGFSIAQLLVDNLMTIKQLMAATADDLQSVQGIGPQIAVSVVRFFADKHNRRIIERLETAGVQLVRKKARAAVSQRFAGKTFVLTGTLSSLTRDEARQRIESMGGKVVSSVSKNTDFVVVGEEPGSKLEKARELDRPLLDEKKFITMLQNEFNSQSPT